MVIVSQEYPHHLVQLKDVKRMEQFLDNWQTFDRLFEKEHSKRMLKYWQLVSACSSTGSW